MNKSPLPSTYILQPEAEQGWHRALYHARLHMSTNSSRRAHVPSPTTYQGVVQVGAGCTLQAGESAQPPGCMCMYNYSPVHGSVRYAIQHMHESGCMCMCMCMYMYMCMYSTCMSRAACACAVCCRPNRNQNLDARGDASRGMRPVGEQLSVRRGVPLTSYFLLPTSYMRRAAVGEATILLTSYFLLPTSYSLLLRRAAVGEAR